MFGELCERCGCFLELHKRDLLTDSYTSATGAAAIRTLHAKDEGCMSYTVLAIEPAWAPASNHEF